MRTVRSGFAMANRPQLWVGVMGVIIGAVGVLSVFMVPPSAQPLGMHTQPANPRVHGAFTTASLPPSIRHIDCSARQCLALTFDDGPNAATTPMVLDALERHHARATFFVIGNRVPGNEALLRRMYRSGQEIGSHSWSHPDLTTLQPQQVQQQFVQTQAVVSGAGVPAPTLFRPPYGAVNASVKNQIPLTFAMWNVDPEDWRSKDPKEIIAKVEAGVRPGRVVDLHDVHRQTAEALDQLLTDIERQYQLVTFSELFDLTPGQPGLFYGR